MQLPFRSAVPRIIAGIAKRNGDCIDTLGACTVKSLAKIEKQRLSIDKFDFFRPEVETCSKRATKRRKNVAYVIQKNASLNTHGCC